MLGRDAEVVGVARAGLEDEAERRVGVDDPPDVAVDDLLIERLALDEAKVLLQRRVAQARVALERELIDDVARPLVDEELDLRLRLVRREEHATADAGVEEALRAVILAHGCHVVVEHVLVERPRAGDPDPDAALDLRLQPVLADRRVADEIDVADADVGPLVDDEDEVALGQLCGVDGDAGERVVLRAVKLFDRPAGQGDAEVVDRLVGPDGDRVAERRGVDRAVAAEGDAADGLLLVDDEGDGRRRSASAGPAPRRWRTGEARRCAGNPRARCRGRAARRRGCARRSAPPSSARPCCREPRPFQPSVRRGRPRCSAPAAPAGGSRRSSADRRRRPGRGATRPRPARRARRRRHDGRRWIAGGGVRSRVLVPRVNVAPAAHRRGGAECKRGGRGVKNRMQKAE